MTISKSLAFLSILMLTTGLTLSASSIVTVTFEGTGGVTNSAGNEVLPYFLSINGAAPVAADCYDFLLSITPGETWTANVDTLAEAVASGTFSSNPGALAGYKLIAVLGTLAAISPQNDIDLQQDIWNVFDPGKFTLDPGMTSFLSTANADLPTFNFSRVEFIEPAAGVSAQPFLLLVETPEPSTMFLIGAGLLAMAGVKRFKIPRHPH